MAKKKNHWRKIVKSHTRRCGKSKTIKIISPHSRRTK